MTKPGSQGGLIMLVLTRKVGEEIVIDGNIRVTVLEVKGGKIRLGITAPPHIPVDREEVHQKRAEFSVKPAIVLAKTAI
jgi:carbon storage regulator